MAADDAHDAPGLSRDGFERLLALLDPDRLRAAEHYEALRARLIKFFEWEQAGEPESLADEAVNRVARRLAQGEQVRDARAYFLGVARMLVKETFARRERERTALARRPEPDAPAPDSAAEAECLRCCLERLPAETRAFILRYYQGEKSARIEKRRLLAAEYGIPLNALRNRALRLRARLERCMRACGENAGRDRDVSPFPGTNRREKD